MADLTENFVKDSNNIISLTLTEDGTAISGAWTDLDIDFYRNGTLALNISRTADGTGVALNTSTGILTINPAQLSETLTDLIAGVLYRIFITVKDSTNPEGAIFGAEDSTSRLYFLVTDPT